MLSGCQGDSVKTSLASTRKTDENETPRPRGPSTRTIQISPIISIRKAKSGRNILFYNVVSNCLETIDDSLIHSYHWFFAKL